MDFCKLHPDETVAVISAANLTHVNIPKKHLISIYVKTPHPHGAKRFCIGSKQPWLHHNPRKNGNIHKQISQQNLCKIWGRKQWATWGLTSRMEYLRRSRSLFVLSDWYNKQCYTKSDRTGLCTPLYSIGCLQIYRKALYTYTGNGSHYASCTELWYGNVNAFFDPWKGRVCCKIKKKYKKNSLYSPL